MVGARKNTSRAEELICAATNCVVGPDLDGINIILGQFSQHPSGGTYEHTNGTRLVWGNVERLLGSTGHTQIADVGRAIVQYQLPRSQPPRYVVLMDSLLNGATTLTGVSDQAMAILKNVKGKADLTVIEDDVIRELSVKRPNLTEVKLGQQSRREDYQFRSSVSTLSGGKNLPNLREAMSDLTRGLGEISRPNSLTEYQWGRLTEDDKRLAAAKQLFPDQWKEIVRHAMTDAGAELDSFLTDALPTNEQEHSYNLGVLLSHRLIGGMTEGHEEWITSAHGPFRLELAIQKLADTSALRATWSRQPSKSGKDSWVITARVGNRRYVICKIEPSFDGAKPEVSQTKGVIYYFQEGSGLRAPADGSVWDLLSDVSG
jgi:hypothetical protein